MEVNHITLSLVQGQVRCELVHSQLLYDLEDIKLLVQLLLAFLKQLVLSLRILATAEAPWTREVLEFKQSPSTVTEWSSMCHLILDHVQVLLVVVLIYLTVLTDLSSHTSVLSGRCRGVFISTSLLIDLLLLFPLVIILIFIITINTI